MAVTLTDARDAVAEVRRAADVIARVRNVRVRVTVGWQQIDDVSSDAAEELKKRLTETAEAWLAEQSQAVAPAGEVKFECLPAADLNNLHVELPMIWMEGLPNGRAASG